MMILNKEGFIYNAVPNIVSKKDERGNRYAVQEGFKTDKIPLMKVVMFGDKRRNPALDALMETGLVIVSQL